ncbi:unnamed protein product, partial [Vitis vinifera]
MDFMFAPYGEGITFQQRVTTARARGDAISIRTCQETDGPILEPLEDRWAQWLGGFKPGSVIFCAFGSQNVHEKDQFQELLLGLELTGLPFFAAVKPRTGVATIEEALPEGFQERVGGRGLVHGGWWVQQPSVLSHPSVGCFVSHCGYGSMWESLTSDPQIVLVPELADQILNSRLLAEELKVAVEVEREENGLFSKESLCDAIKSVMDENSEVGGLVKKNHAKWKVMRIQLHRIHGHGQDPKISCSHVPMVCLCHMTPFLHLSNKLVERSHKITFMLPKKAQSQLQTLNFHPTLISFNPLTVPQVEGLPPGAETTAVIPIFLNHLLTIAMDRTADQVEAALHIQICQIVERDTFNAYWIFCHAKSVFSRNTFNINPIFWNCRRCLLKRRL